MEPSPFIHGQESVTVDALDADDALRNREELQDTCGKDRQHAAVTGGFRGGVFMDATSPDVGVISCYLYRTACSLRSTVCVGVN